MTKTVTVQSDPEWAQRLADLLSGAVADDPRWTDLAARLLKIGGGGVAARPEEDMDALLNDDLVQVWSGDYMQMSEGGAPNQCHSNSVALYDTYDDLSIATGWALSEDGCWRQHTWCVDDNGMVIETTVPRLEYYGFILEGEKLDEFRFYNF